jgi:hypothetical protein
VKIQENAGANVSEYNWTDNCRRGRVLKGMVAADRGKASEGED